MATSADADIILRLYDLRREPLMRKARAFVIFEWNPASSADLLAVQRGAGSEQNAQWRQVVSYWEMASSFCLRGAVDTDLFIDSNSEPFLIYAKFFELYEAATGQPFMPQTAKLIHSHKGAQGRHGSMVSHLARRRAEAAAHLAQAETPAEA